MPLISRKLDSVPGRVTLQWSMTASADRVWWGLTDPEALPQWMGSVTSGQFTAGSMVTVQHAENYSCTSEIINCEPRALLAMTWKFPDEPLSNVRIELTPHGLGTRLELTHGGLGEEAAGYLPGWQTHLLYLENLLQGRPRSMADFWTVYGELENAAGSGGVAVQGWSCGDRSSHPGPRTAEPQHVRWRGGYQFAFSRIRGLSQGHLDRPGMD